MALSAVIMGGEKDDLDIQLADRQTDNLAIARGKEPMPNISGMPIPPDAGDPHDKEKPRPATVRGGMNINDWLQKPKTTRFKKAFFLLGAFFEPFPARQNIFRLCPVIRQ